MEEFEMLAKTAIGQALERVWMEDKQMSGWLPPGCTDKDVDDAAPQGPEYECHYCGDYYASVEERLAPSQYDGGLDVILVCKRPACQAIYANELNLAGLAVIVQKVAG
jgi:hypothetical protein